MSGQKILEGLKQAADGDFGRVTIGGQTWVRQDRSGYDHPYNDGYTHEAMHTASVLMDAWDSHVIETRCADHFPEVKVAVEAAMKAMWEAYQTIGRQSEASP